MSFSRKVFGVFSRDIVLYGTNIITGVFVARTLGPTVLGIWGVLALIPAYAEAFGRLKTDVSSVYFIGKKTFPEESILLSLNIIALVMSGLIIALVIIFFNSLYNLLFQDATGEFFTESKVILIQIPIQFLYQNYAYYHISHENTYVYNRMVIINAWVNTSLVLVLLLVFDLGIYSLIISLISACFCALLYGYFKVNRTSWKSSRFDVSLSYQMIKYAKHMYFSGLIAHFQEHGTKTIAVTMLKANQIAFFGQAQSIGKMLLRIVDAINLLLYPRVSGSNREDSISITCQAYRMASLVLFIGALTFYLLADFMVLFLYGEEFIMSASLLKIILPGVLVFGVSSTLNSFYNGSGRAFVIPRIQLPFLFFQLLLAYSLTSLYGIKGSMWSLTIGMVVYSFVLTAYFKKETKTPIKNLLPSLNEVKAIAGLISYYTGKIRLYYDKKR